MWDKEPFSHWVGFKRDSGSLVLLPGVIYTICSSMCSLTCLLTLSGTPTKYPKPRSAGTGSDPPNHMSNQAFSL